MEKLVVPRELVELVSLDEIDSFVIFNEPEVVEVVEDEYNGEVDDCLADIAQMKINEEFEEVDCICSCEFCSSRICICECAE